MIAIPYRITLQEPVLATGLEGDPNDAISLPYIPGSMVRGVLIGRILADGQTDEAKMRALFFADAVRCLNAYPAHPQNAARLLPLPLSWRERKDKPEKGMIDAAQKGMEKDIEYRKPRGGEFCLLKCDENQEFWNRADLHSPAYTIQVHTTRTRRFGRAVLTNKTLEADEIEGTVYRYQSLAAEQTFAGVVLCRKPEDAERLLPLLNGEWTLGGARDAGYGRVLLKADTPLQTGWSEIGTLRPEPQDDGLTLTLLSHLLLRDPTTGQYTVDAAIVTQALSAKLKTSLTLQSEHTFLSKSTVGGFNRKWGLPLPQIPAVAMGSVFVFKTEQGVKREALHSALTALETEGMGDRREDGFGRLAFDWLPWEELDGEQAAANPYRGIQPILKSEIGIKLAETMTARMQHTRLESALITAINLTIPNIKGKLPAKSQIARLRGVIQNALYTNPPDRERVEIFLDDIERRKVASVQFEDTKLAGALLLKWLREELGRTAENDWVLSHAITEEKLPAIGNVSATLDDTLRLQWTLRYLDGVLARMEKESRKEEG